MKQFFKLIGEQKKSSLREMLINNRIEDIAFSVMPASKYTMHVGKEYNVNKNLLIHIVKHFSYILGVSFIEITKYLFQKRQKLSKAEYNTLIYVPNFKYHDFLKSIIKVHKGSFYIITIENMSNGLNVRNYTDKKILLGIFRFLIMYFTYSVKTLVIDKSKFLTIVKNKNKTFKLIRYNFVYEKLFSKITVRNYLSLAPSTDQHQILYKLFNSCFNTGFAIRPETTTITPEHSTISCDILFHKSELEKKYYIKSGLSSKIKLVKAGALFNDEDLMQTTIKSYKYIILYDTNIIKDEQKNISRLNFLNDFITLFNKTSNYKIYIKPHPGLPKAEKKQLNKLTKKLSIRVISNQNNQILGESHIAISFYSTVLQNLILRKKPIALVSSYYNNLTQKDNNELIGTPVRQIKDINDLKELRERIINNNINWFSAKEIFDWYTQTYNIPDGRVTLLKHLESGISD